MGLRPTRLTVEYAESPLGIGTERPRLGWQCEGRGRGQAQSAYHVLCASSPEVLDRQQGDLWDSGRVVSSDSCHIPYRGRELHSGETVVWKVRVWDNEGVASDWSPSAQWEMGWFHGPSGRWIGAGRGAAELSLGSGNWIRRGDTAESKTVTRFRRVFHIPSDRTIVHSWLLSALDGEGTVTLNGQPLERAVFPRMPRAADPTRFLVGGENTLLVELAGHGPRVALRLQMLLAGGATVTVDTDAEWSCQDASDPHAPWEPVIIQASDVQSFRQARGLGIQGESGWHQAVRPGPNPYLRRTFTVSGRVRRARLYATALGLYELRLNGARVGDELLTPGWTDYDRRVQVQTFDVTDQLVPGGNVIGAILGSGWYCGRIACGKYGDRPLFAAVLQVEYGDGRSEMVVSDSSWRCATGPILTSDIYDGEVYDARLEWPGWDAVGFDDRLWGPVTVAEMEGPLRVPQVGPAVRVTGEMKPVQVSQTEPGVWIYDMGQNMVGWVRLQVRGAAGTVVRLRFAEVLDSNGNLYTESLRSALQTDTYRLRGDPEGEVFEPHFTYHGFRYVELCSDVPLAAEPSVLGRVVHSDTPLAGTLETSHPLINRLQQNIVWSQRGNFVSVPTDCPQRDERAGWTGDALIFAPTACFNMEVLGFFTKWLIDLRDAQLPSGIFPNVAPRVPWVGDGCSAAWGDAGVVVPWTLWRRYGDRRVIEEHYDAMCRWVEYLTHHTQGLLRPAEGFGDWLNLDDDTPKDLIATAFFAHSVDLLGRMAGVTDHFADQRRYERLFADVATAFASAYVATDGRVGTGSQTAAVLALAFGLVPAELRDATASHLVQAIADRGGHLTTGFLGTAYLLPTLSDNGHHDVAVRLLLRESFPSWLYEVRSGATTTWERWDGWTEQNGFQNPGMNSFNHYAYGAVGDWMVRYLAGLDLDAGEPGGRLWLIRPRPGEGISSVRATYQSLYGVVAVAWRVGEGMLHLDLTVPANTAAMVYVPTSGGADGVREGKIAAAAAPGVALLRSDPGLVVYGVSAGQYAFTAPLPSQ